MRGTWLLSLTAGLLLTTGASAHPKRVARAHAAEPRGPSPFDLARSIEQETDPVKQEARCRTLTGYRGEEFQTCSAEPIAHGAALVIRVTTACHAPTCEVLGWVLGRSGTALRVPGDAAGVVEGTPALDVVVKDWVHQDARGEWTVSTVRIDLRTGAQRPFAECMSPRLSPGGRWFACRDRDGGVLRVSTQGGKTELVAEGDAGRVTWLPAVRAYPDPPSFADPRTVTYDLRRKGEGEAVETVRVPFRE